MVDAWRARKPARLMTAKTTVTTSMIWLGLLVFLSQGWLAAVRDWIQKLSGTTPDEATETEAVTSTGPWWETTREDIVNGG
jgi:hypothetical protein